MRPRSSRKARSSQTNTTQRAEQHEALVSTLETKTQSFSGVNLDEEMSNLILYEQAYSAAARLVSVIQEMFQALERAMS